ncbi:MAG: diaminopimelate decarboxylase [Candidatus Omnitrophica bacterium]|nr:diaminopimelate decarboxylase [Candidatus Omnitrophota bacterium]
MHYFHYLRKSLYCESVQIQRIAQNIATPFYLYSYKTLISHYDKIREAFKSLDPLICFSMKSNSNLSIVRSLVGAGAGLDIVSGGELFKAKKAGADMSKIVYAGAGKTPLEIEDAIRSGILLFNVESLPELVLINKLCSRLRKKVKAAIRVNPGVRAGTHKYITTGAKGNKFGIDEDTLLDIFNQSRKFPNVEISGIHMHIGSQITQAGPFVRAVKKISSLIARLRSAGHKVDYLNIGGGLGIVYGNEKPQTARDFANSIVPMVSKLNVKLILEPGRFISGNSGVLVSKVLYVKKSFGKNFIIVDAGMNDLVRPSLYGAFHDILPLRKATAGARYEKSDVVGPVCESGDFIAKDRNLPSLKQGDFIAVMGAGAYGFSMSSNYNARPRAAEIMVIDGSYHTVRKRECYQDLIRGEIIPKRLYKRV